ncbi:MAG: 2-oxoisovalerate dehydrogenase [Acidobacteria bacterium]|nr:2-oxoisovalerate dehydrogenase [Acidobacteriota bacterium]
MRAEELTFVAERESGGGYTARALGESIFTEADDFESLREMVLDAARCHFDEGCFPRRVSIHTVLFEQEK